MKITKFVLEQWYVEYEFKSKYNLSASGIKTLKYNQLGNLDYLDETNITYSPAQGNEHLVNIIAEMNKIDNSNILITNGAIEALFLAQISLFEKGDNVIVVKPTYPALYQIAEDIGANIIDWDLEFDNNFIPDLNKLESMMEKHQPKALIINFPNNPTGANLNSNQKSKIIEICKKYNCYLISDEVYSKLDLKKQSYFPYYDKKITIDSLSKGYGLPGLRIGWVIAEEQLIKKMQNLRHYTTLCNNVISEKIAFNVLNKSDAYISNNLELLEKNKEIALETLNYLKSENKIDYIEPDSGLMIFIKLKNIDDSEKFCIDFEDKTSILLLPGNKYGDKYKNFFRLGFGIDTDNLKFCLEELKNYMMSL